MWIVELEVDIKALWLPPSLFADVVVDCGGGVLLSTDFSLYAFQMYPHSNSQTLLWIVGQEYTRNDSHQVKGEVRNLDEISIVLEALLIGRYYGGSYVIRSRERCAIWIEIIK